MLLYRRDPIALHHRRHYLYHRGGSSRHCLYCWTTPGKYDALATQTTTDLRQGIDCTTPYTDFGCAFPVDTSATSPVSGGLLNVLSISSCLSACRTRGYRFAYITNLAVSICRCSSNVQIRSPSVCGLGRNYIYVNRNVAPTGVARKRMIDAQKRSEDVGLCPTGLSACQVGHGGFDSDAFEVSPPLI